MALATLVAGCHWGGGKGDPVVIPALYNLTGGQAQLDGPSAHGASLAVDQANRAGGVLGRPVQLALSDGGTDLDLIAKRADALWRRHPGAPAMIGLSDTTMVRVAARLAAAHERLFLTSGATSPRLPEEVPEFLFLACFGDNVQAAAGAEWAFRERGARSVSVLYSTSDDYTLLLQHYFRAHFEQLGGQVVSMQPYARGDLGRDTIGGVAPADLIYLAAQPEDAVRAVELLRGAGVQTPVLGGDGLDAATLWAQHPQLARVYFTTHAYLGEDNPDPRVQGFRAAYQAAFPGSPIDAFAALGYDTVRLLLAAIERAGSTDPQAVRAALAETQDFVGLTGAIGYAAGSRVPLKPVSIIEVRDGRRHPVARFVPDGVPPP